MHRVLQIPEVLLNIFGNLVSANLSTGDSRIIGRDLAALARTCRTFKEPALDILWSELDDFSALSRCLPKISRQTVSGIHISRSKKFSFTRSLQHAEWDRLRSYTRRVWCIRESHCDKKLDWKFLRDLTPSASPLFPNLRSLHCTFTEEIIPFLHLPFPSLTRLDIHFTILRLDNMDLGPVFQDPLESLVKTSPNIKKLDIQCSIRGVELSKVISDGICGLSNLQTITCPSISLDVDTFVHLSHIPTLARLTFSLSDTFLDSPAPSNSLSLLALKYMEVNAESLSPVSSLLLRIRLPAITDLIVTVYACPSKQDLASFMAGVQMSGMGYTVRVFDLEELYDESDIIEPRPTDAPLLELDDLQSCLAFQNLCRMNIDLNWNVCLSDDQLLMLGSEWPQLQEFTVNSNWGWGWDTLGGITPVGLARLLEMCPSLTSIALAIDTQGFVKAPSAIGQPRKAPNPSSFGGPFRINVIDSVIEPESVDAMVAFLFDIVPHFHFTLTCWAGWTPESEYSDLDRYPYRERWEDVYTRASELIRNRWLDLVRRLLFQS